MIPVVLSAQQVKTAHGKVYAIFDKESQPLPDANISILEAKDSTLVIGGIAKSDGYFNVRFAAAKNKQYLMRVSYTGMEPAYIEIGVNEITVDAGTIFLREGVELAEFVITAPLREIVQVGDTMVINAEAFQTPEGSYLEELVKRIPGLEYDQRNKSLRYNGKDISSINVNGEEFFSGNNRMALENLPVELISKIKVYDKRNPLEKITGIRSGGENYVLDIQTKGELSGTMLGSVKAGRGNNRKKESELIGNYFKQNGENISLIANSGNREMTSRYKDNIQHMVGANFTVKPAKKISINGNATYTNNRDGNQSTGVTEQYLSSGNRYQLSSDENINKQNAFGAYAGLIWEIDDKTYFNVFGNFNYMEGEGSNRIRQALFDADPQADLKDPFAEIDHLSDNVKINDNTMHSLSSNRMKTYSISANLTRRINSKGSNISLVFQNANNSGDNGSVMNSSITYYRLQNETGKDSILNRVQSHLSPSGNRNQRIGLMFTHPVTEKFNVQLSYNLVRNIQESDRNTYDLSGFIDDEADNIQRGKLPPGYESDYIDSLSNRSNSRTLAHELALRMHYSNERWDLNTGFTVRPERRSIDQKTGLLQADTANNIMGIEPLVMVNWKKEKYRIGFNYQGNTGQPALNDLLSLTDNSDPLNITRGNPDLKTTYSQSVRLDFTDNGRNFSAILNWQNTINSITHTVIYNLHTGGRESYPVNINGNWSGNGMLRYMKRLSKFRIVAQTGSSYNQNINLVNEGRSEQPERSITRSTGFNANLRLSYLPKWGSFETVGNWRFLHSLNNLRQTDNYTRNYTITINSLANLPGNLQITSDATYIFRNGTNIGRGDHQLVWNTGVSWRFMKKKQGELSAYWSDILSKKKEYERSVTAEGFHEHYTPHVSSYFIISFKYNFNIILQK